MDNQGAIGRGAFWSIINSGLGQLLVLIVFFVTARFVSTADFGVMAVCLLVVELFRQVAIESVATAVTSSHKPTEQEYDTCFVMILIASATSAAIAFLGAGLLADLMGNPRIKHALQLVSVLLLTVGLSRTHEAWLSRQLQFKALAQRSIISILIGGAVGIAMAINGFGLTSLIAQQLVTALVATATLWAITDWKPRISVDRQALGRLWRFSRHVAVTGFTNFANTQSDTFFASYFLGSAQTGVYNAAKRILLGLNLVLSTALSRVALPSFANARSDPQRLAAMFLSAVSLTSTVTAPVFFGLMVVSADVVHIALGPRWLEVGPILSWISLAGFLVTIGQYNQSVLLVYDKPHWQSILTAIYAISNIVLFFVVVRYGLIALAIGYTARAVLLYPLSIGGALHLLRLKSLQYLRCLASPICAAVIMALGVYGLRLFVLPNDPFLRLAISVVCGALIYGGCLALWGRREIRALMTLGIKVIYGK